MMVIDEVGPLPESTFNAIKDAERLANARPRPVGVFEDRNPPERNRHERRKAQALRRRVPTIGYPYTCKVTMTPEDQRALADALQPYLGER